MNINEVLGVSRTTKGGQKPL